MKNDQQDNQFKFSPSVVAWPLYFVLLLWIIYWVEIKFNLDLTHYGIYPRTFVGLRGVVLSPFLHGGLEHLYNNSLALLVLIAAIRYFYRDLALRVIVYGILLSGFITWMIGRESYHIGASGLIYVLVSFMFFKGIQTGYYRLVALSLMIIVLYGGMIWYVLPEAGSQGISWEGHLGGLISGFLFARLYQTPDYQKAIVYDWQKPDFDPQQDPFMKRFDENGNFVNPPKPEPEVEVQLDTTHHHPVLRIVYTYTEIPKEEDSSDENTIDDTPSDKSGIQ